MSEATPELTPDEKAEIARKMDTPLATMPITMNTLVSIQNLPAVPEIYRGKPKEMMTAALMGRELTIGPLTAINNIDIIEGSVSLRAKLMSALIHKAGHIIVVKEQTDERCVLGCKRYHAPTNSLIDVGDIEYTLEDAQRSGDAAKGTYKKHPRAMLTNRALTLAGRTVYGDALAGIGYTADEIGHADEPDEIPEELDGVDLSELEEPVVEAEVVE